MDTATIIQNGQMETMWASWQICMMYSIYLLGIMAKDILHGRRQKILSIALLFSSVINCTIVLVSFSGLAVMYDMLPYWVSAQLLFSPVLILCCVLELINKKTEIPALLVLFILLFLCICFTVRSWCVQCAAR